MSKKQDEEVKDYDGEDLDVNEVELEDVGIIGVACRCHCGYKSRLMKYLTDYWVECTRPNCWTGPVCNRKDKAVDVWNRVLYRFIANGRPRIHPKKELE